MNHFKNILADVFSTGILLNGFFYNVDWAKVLGAIGVIAAVANHVHQIYHRNKNKNKPQ